MEPRTVGDLGVARRLSSMIAEPDGAPTIPRQPTAIRCQDRPLTVSLKDDH